MRTYLLTLAAPLALAGCATITGGHTGDVHSAHAHVHGEDCGHEKVWHAGHWDYLHDGHLHHVHSDHVDEHVLEVTAQNPAGETPLDPAVHAGHTHGESDAEHKMIPHDDHMDHIHNGRLHHVHGDHVDDHGPVRVEANG